MPQDAVIDVARCDDLAAIEDVRRAAFSRFAPEHYTADDVRNLLDEFDPAEVSGMIGLGTLFVARLGGAAVGCAGWQGDTVRHVYVRPDLTGGGIGSRLLARAEDDMRRRTGATMMHANVIVYATGFYERNGYRVVARDRAWDGSAYYRMIKAVPRAR